MCPWRSQKIASEATSYSSILYISICKWSRFKLTLTYYSLPFKVAAHIPRRSMSLLCKNICITTGWDESDYNWARKYQSKKIISTFLSWLQKFRVGVFGIFIIWKLFRSKFSIFHNVNIPYNSLSVKYFIHLFVSG